jgi:hypothetical protein
LPKAKSTTHKPPVGVSADPTRPQQEQQQLHKQRTDEQIFIEANRKVGPMFGTVDDTDDPAVYKIMPEIIEPVTTRHRDRVIVRVFPSGNRGKATLHLPDFMKDRLGIKYAFEGGGTGNNLVELEMDEDWKYIRIKKVPRLQND